jgi:hypothetical protein
MKTVVVYVETMPQEVGGAAILSRFVGATLLPYRLGTKPSLPADTEKWITFGTYHSIDELNAWPGSAGHLFLYESECSKIPDTIPEKITITISGPERTHIKAVWSAYCPTIPISKQYVLLDERIIIKERAPDDSFAALYHLGLTVEKAMKADVIADENNDTIGPGSLVALSTIPS